MRWLTAPMSFARLATSALVALLGACSPTEGVAPELSGAFREADNFAREASLPSLRDVEGPELRLWFMDYESGRIHGSIVRPDGITIVEIYPLPLSAEYGDPSVRSVVAPEASAEALGMMESLRHVTFHNCQPVMDGGGITIEGVDGHGRFAFTQENPHHCEVINGTTLDRVFAVVDAGTTPAPSP